MASVKHLTAVQGFLRGVRSLSTYEVTRDRQFRQVEKVLGKTAAFTAAQASTWLGSVDGTLWSASQVEVLKELVAERTRDVPDEGAAKQAPQDYTMLPYHLTEELWKAVEEGLWDRETLLRRLCTHAASLGLRYGSEATKATLVALAYWSKLRDGVSAWEQHDLYVRQKPRVTKYLSFSPAEPHLLELPLRGVDLPVELRPAEPGQLSDARKALAFEVGQFVRQMPLRKDHRSLQGDGEASARGTADGMLPLAAVCQVVRACTGMAQQVPRGEPAGGAPRQLMLEDGCVDSQERERSPRRPASPVQKAVAVGADLAALRGSREGQEGQEEVSQGGEEQDVEPHADAGNRETAPKSKAKPQGKAACKAKGKAKAAPSKQQVMKRPAKKPGSVAGAAAERSAMREALLQRVPAALKRRYAAGCSTCRYRPLCTISCWAKRGFAP